MSVEERLMAAGQWSVKLNEKTPKSVRDALKLEDCAFGHIIITPVHLDESAPTSAAVLAAARYTGVYRGRPSEYELKGAAPAIWLGDEDGKGDIIETALTKTAGTFVQWITDLRPASLTAGTYNTIAGSLTHSFLLIDRRTALDYLCDYFGAEWKITPDLKLHGGVTADLFVTTPTAIVQRRSGGKDSNIAGIRADLDTDKDFEDYTTRVVLVAGGAAAAAAVGGADISPATSFRDINGNLVEWARLVDSADTVAGNETTVAASQLALFNTIRRGVKLSSDAYDIGADVEVGDTIHVWDEQLDLFDLTNPVQYRGDLLYPIELRVLAYTWPVLDGMGVYFRKPDSSGTIVDLTDWVLFEDGDTSIEVGAWSREDVNDEGKRSSLQRPAALGPQGVLGRGTFSADQGTIGAITALSGLSDSVTLGPSRQIKFGFRILVGAATVAGQGIYVTVYESGAEVCRLYQDNDYPRTTGGSTTDRVITGEATIDVIAAGSHSFDLRAGRIGGSGTFTVFGSQIQSQFWIEDIGLAV